MCFDLTHAPVATTARGAATGPVSMSTRPDPEGSDTVEIANPEMSSSPGTVGLALAHPLTKTQAMEPSRQTWSSYGPPYPLGRWSSDKPGIYLPVRCVRCVKYTLCEVRIFQHQRVCNVR